MLCSSHGYTIVSLWLSNFLHRDWHNFSLIFASWEAFVADENRPFQPPKRSRSHKNPRVKTGRTCLTIPREKAVSETDATSCRRTVGSWRYPFVMACSGSFQKYGKICRAGGKPGEYKRVGGGGSKIVLRQCWLRVGYWRSRGRSVHKEGSPEYPSFLLYSLSFSRSLLQHRQTWSNRFLRPFFMARVHRAAFCCRYQCTGTLHARGEVFAFRKIQRILLPRPCTRISAPESQFRERVLKKMGYI